jgi:hypothetical protein
MVRVAAPLSGFSLIIDGHDHHVFAPVFSLIQYNSTTLLYLLSAGICSAAGKQHAYLFFVAGAYISKTTSPFLAAYRNFFRLSAF